MHVIWDWNGTLFDDLHIVVDAVNESLAAVGAARRIDADGYRDHYRRPVRSFYDVLLDRAVSDTEWSLINDRFHEAYAGSLDRAGVAADAHAAAAEVIRRGATQSILSMWTHDQLVPAVRAHGLESFMLAVRGSRRAEGDRKARLLSLHLEELALPRLVPVVIIGDTFDDAAAAAEVGIGAVFYDGGSHHIHELHATGVPVADTLLEAIDIASTL